MSRRPERSTGAGGPRSRQQVSAGRSIQWDSRKRTQSLGAALQLGSQRRPLPHPVEILHALFTRLLLRRPIARLRQACSLGEHFHHGLLELLPAFPGDQDDGESRPSGIRADDVSPRGVDPGRRVASCWWRPRRHEPLESRTDQPDECGPPRGGLDLRHRRLERRDGAPDPHGLRGDAAGHRRCLVRPLAFQPSLCPRRRDGREAVGLRSGDRQDRPEEPLRQPRRLLLVGRGDTPHLPRGHRGTSLGDRCVDRPTDSRLWPGADVST